MLGVALFFVFLFASNGTTYRESRGGRVASLASEERIQEALTETGAALALLAPVLMIWLLLFPEAAHVFFLLSQAGHQSPGAKAL